MNIDLHSTLGLAVAVSLVGQPAMAEPALFVAYPPQTHETVSDRIFFIGTAAPDTVVRINGQVVEHRSPSGHFAPTLPLTLGENDVTITAQDQTLRFTILRRPLTPPLPQGVAFADGSLKPDLSLARLPGELICFSAIAPAAAQVTVALAHQQIPLTPQPNRVELPPNSAVLTDQTGPYNVAATPYSGCITPNRPGDLGRPEFQLRLNGQTVTQAGAGTIEILAPTTFQIAEVTAESGTARTGPSTDYSRLTPLPQGTQATITGREGDWLRLDYGGWIRENEVRMFSSPMPPRTIIRGITSQQTADWTEVSFPLQVPVPVSLEQGTTQLTLRLYNTVPQTDTIYFSDDPVVERLDWRPILPDQVEYTFHFKTEQQWGYQLRYEGTTLILSLRHPPVAATSPLQGTRILLDPGHGGEETGALGPNGYPEKAVNLTMAQRLRTQLQARGATVILTRETDQALSLRERMDRIDQEAPTLALSLHYNALPDNGDALHTAGIGAFWYHPQAHDLALFLHDYLVNTLKRPDYGVYWNNLALTRPTVAPTVLLELGFMINPDEFEWVTNPDEQQKLALALADGIEAWLAQRE
jgi:N-acetylmuramoyl-L-alanine amidase